MSDKPSLGTASIGTLPNIRFGLNCIFALPTLKFRTIKATPALKLSRESRMKNMGAIWLHNANMLMLAVRQLKEWGIGAYVVFHPLLPLYTLPDLGFTSEDLDEWPDIERQFGEVKRYCKSHHIRLSFHPDQYVLPGSPVDTVRCNSITNLRYHAMLCEHIGADTINLHLGGTYGNKQVAMARFIRNAKELPSSILSRLAIENDDKLYTPTDVSHVADDLGIPFMYDVHHHRLNPDGLSIEEATELSVRSWRRQEREPYLHIASSRDASGTGRERSAHADYVEARDFPECWLTQNQPLTVIVESKGREQAVLKLRADLVRRMSEKG